MRADRGVGAPAMAFAMAVSVLLALAVMASIASSAPLLSPNFADCRNITLKYTSTNYRCCPPIPRVIKDWKFQDHLPMRVRRPAHTLINDTEYWDKYNRAYALLRALPSDDPRSWENQAWMHCSYCNNALIQNKAGPETVLLVHKGWLFLPWHRWYVYFHERILAKLIGDDTFALPFWNFDNQTSAAAHFPSNTLPPQYTKQRWGALRDSKRSKYHQPPQTVDIPFDWVVEEGDSPYSAKELVNRNLQSMHRQVAGAAVPEVFFGHRYVEGTPDAPGGGTLEYIPHNSIHDWTGDLTQPDHENMGNFYSAARDPVFYGLHCNLDRLWQVWKKIGGRRKDIAEPDWLQSEFLFFDENGDGVRVNIADTLDMDKLRYRYEEVENAWIDLNTPALGSPILKAAAKAARAHECKHNSVSALCKKMMSWVGSLLTPSSSPLSSILESTAVPSTMDPESAAQHLSKIPLLQSESSPGQAPVTIGGSPFHFRVERPVKSSLRLLSEAFRLKPVGEEGLTLQGLTTPLMKTNIFDVFLNLPEVDSATPITIAEYAGTFYEIPHTSSAHQANGEVIHRDWRVTNFRLSIGEVLKQIGAYQSQEPLVVSIVPRGVDKMEPLIVKGVTVELM
eukprot:TRINITY_DN438_c0_g1_i1.p1 TRINITY_DN438_c0_g1~~TRINITY_DN438_c0_g1_i1.p1  ORF type:complete len:621 (-),score=78.68 TRINITY_DN438_c0_g1_i1:638-2500(-)